MKMTDNIPIQSVDAIKQYIELTKNMINRIESGDIRFGDPNLESLKAALKDLNRKLEEMSN
jgi:transcriptional regulator with XRE-family HTH domain